MRLLALLVLVLLAAAPAHALDKGLVVSSCGAPTIAAGGLAQVTQDTTGRMCAGGFTAPCQAAANYLARTVGGNEGGNALNIENLICGLVSDGVITGNLSGTYGGCGTYLDMLYVQAQQNAADAGLNLCGTSYTLAPGANSFTAYRGWTQTSSGIGTGFAPSTSPSPRYIQNSASIGVWYNAATAEGTAILGGSVNIRLFPNHSSGFFLVRVNNPTNWQVAPPQQSGYYAGERSAAANLHGFFNGADLGAQSQASVAVDSSAISLGGSGQLQVINAAHVGAALGPTLQLALYNRLRTYMTAVGVP